MTFWSENLEIPSFMGFMVGIGIGTLKNPIRSGGIWIFRDVLFIYTVTSANVQLKNNPREIW